MSQSPKFRRNNCWHFNDPGYSATRSTYSLAGQPIAIQVTSNNPSEPTGLYYVHTDHLGSVSAMSDESGDLAGNIVRFEPFGDYRPGSGPSDITDRGFTGHRHNDYIKLIYMGARWYLPGLGRFASADSIVPNPADPQSFNRYTYVLNRPLNLVDPSGHNPICPPDSNCSPPPSSNPNPSQTPPPGAGGIQPAPDLPSGSSSTPSGSQNSPVPCHGICVPGDIIDPFLNFENWEIQLLTMIIINEIAGQPIDQIIYAVWTVINRYLAEDLETVEGFESRLESILIGAPGQFHAAFGEGFEGGVFAGYLAGTGPLGANFISEVYASWLESQPYATEENIQAVKDVINAFNSGAKDPTNGADSFYHVDSIVMGGLGGAHYAELAALEATSPQAAAATGWVMGNGLSGLLGRSRDMVYWKQYGG